MYIYIFALQRHTGQTEVLQALTLGHMRSNDPRQQNFFSFFWLLSTLSIMSTNRASLESGFPVRDAGALTRNAKGYSL